MRRRSLKLYSEPYYPPGYCGYSPQFHFRFGDTYGKTTNQLLQDPNVASSGNTVLADIVPATDRDRENAKNDDWRRMRKLSWGDHKLTDKMVPGYTGYIPGGEHHFGSRYAEICEDAISDFYCKKQNAEQERRKEFARGRKSTMKKLRNDPAPYVSINPVQHSISPYFMSENCPDKTFMSGFTGFIPRSRSRFADGYPVLTMKALREFTRHQQSEKASAKQNVDPSGNSLPNIDRARFHSIYLNSGLLPQYTGYLPGHKFRFGDTYGTSARHFHAEICAN